MPIEADSPRLRPPWFGLPEPVTSDDPQVKCPGSPWSGHVPHAWAILRGVVLTPYQCPGSIPVEWEWDLEQDRIRQEIGRITYMWQMANPSATTKITVIT